MTKFLALLALGVVSGCGSLQTTYPKLGRYVEFRDNLSEQKTRVLLFTGGVGAVEYTGATDSPRHVVLLPVVPKEVERLAKAVDALIDSSIATFFTPQEKSEGLPPGPIPPDAGGFGFVGASKRGIVFMTDYSGRSKSMLLAPVQSRTNLIWSGLRQEVDAVAQIELANAIDWHERSEQVPEAATNPKRRISYLDSAARDLERWKRARARRGDYLYDGGSTYYVGVRTFSITVDANPREIGRELHLSDDEMVDFLEQIWRGHCDALLKTTQFKSMTVVHFDPEMPKWEKSGLPTEIRPDLLEDLGNVVESRFKRADTDQGN